MRKATPSNCGKTLKLCIPSWHGNIASGQVNSLGYGKNCRDATMGNPQPSPKGEQSPMGAVHRLNVGGPAADAAGLRYSRPPLRGGQQEDG